MITLDDVERIHDVLIDKFGGKKGLRDKALLESFVVSAARGEIRFEQIKEWLRNHIEPANEPR